MTWKTWGFENERLRVGLWENPSVKIRFITNAERPPIRDRLVTDPSCFRADGSLGERAGTLCHAPAYFQRFEKSQNALNTNFSDI